MYKIMLLIIGFYLSISCYAQEIPLPEHPRPDFERPDWSNLNGMWSFAFDSLDVGRKENWFNGSKEFEAEINVPFPWGSALSGIDDLADIGWYRRAMVVNPLWEGQRIFLNIGASDWETSVWLDGKLLGKHQGGYVPFSFELTDKIKWGSTQNLIFRVDDIRRDFTLYGKQGYGDARGIWQTIYLEKRGTNYLDAIHFSPDIDNESVIVEAYLPDRTNRDLPLKIEVTGPTGDFTHQIVFKSGTHKVSTSIKIPKLRLWDLDDPYLYEVETDLDGDRLNTYFGMRKISVVDLPGTDYKYVALNNEPVYLQMALDQSYHPEGFYTFPSDQFIIEEIERSKSIGLNGIRTHIKVEVPRKLYWADKLGLLVMEDLPNSWGEPDEYMQAESEYTLRQMVKRDYNHPSIFSWCDFNETWGLRTEVQSDGETKKMYLPRTKNWVASMYYLTKSLDPTRLVEDNSICCGVGHVETDLNSWHTYLPGWAWEDYLHKMSDNIYPGSTFDFEGGFAQGNQPNFNSECGNVWGYEGSTGDVDWSYDYHRMINTFRKYPKVAGWLYTEHHDVVNEWNGYWRFDRSEKETGFGDLVPGMTINDLHSPIYLSTGNEITFSAVVSTPVKVPLYLSVMTGENFGEKLEVSYQISFMNTWGEDQIISGEKQLINYRPWMQETLEPLEFLAPKETGVAIVQLFVKDVANRILHRNFVAIEVLGGKTKNVIPVSAQNFQDANWTKKQWNVLEGLKVNGAGEGYFEYHIPIDEDLSLQNIKAPYFIAEVSAKQLFVKDQKSFDQDQDYMLGSRVFPSSNPNSYPMTDETFFTSALTVWIEGKKAYSTVLPDDPADHRGILSWHHQLKDRKLREAGSYGYLIKVPIAKSTLRKAKKTGYLKVKLQSDDGGGLAIYGSKFGRYPVDPCIVLR